MGKARVIAATLLNPSDPHWEICQSRAKEWADDHVIVEDTTGAAWGQESVWREQLWMKALAASRRDDWIFVLDSDFVLTFDPHELTDTDASTIWAFKLYDLWDAEHYREDQYWHAHYLPRPWMFRAAASPEPPQFGPRGIHTGHFPANFPITPNRVPDHMAILHLGWINPEVRQEKYDRYRKVWNQLGQREREHVESINDPNPNLRELPESMQRHLWLES